VTNARFYTLAGNVQESYIETFAQMTVGNSKSVCNPFIHVLFESFSNHKR